MVTKCPPLFGPPPPPQDYNVGGWASLNKFRTVPNLFWGWRVEELWQHKFGAVEWRRRKRAYATSNEQSGTRGEADLRDENVRLRAALVIARIWMPATHIQTSDLEKAKRFVDFALEQ